MAGQSEGIIARLLIRTWQPFFQRFGRMTPVQLEAVEPILDGKDVLICSPTSSGKTEAVCAPLIERCLKDGKPWQICYISPTRALVNDLFFRLERPVESMGLTIARQTGEHRHNLWSRPDIIITTPESFDSMMCRGRSADGQDHALNTVKAIVLDEIHLLHGTPRGEQICWLLHRLRRMRRRYFERGLLGTDKVQIIALSATIPNPSEIRARYMGPESEEIIVRSSRQIVSVETESKTMAVEDMLKAHIVGDTASSKILVFCNSRSKVDNLAGTIAPIALSKGYAVRAHHGSLSKELREQTEEDARRLKKIIIFATSTLEIGIDVGDIDLVVLDGPPPDLMSFLQRIGRGNRRTHITRVMITARSPQDLLVQYAMVEAAREGWYPPVKIGRCYSVINQQIASYIFQNPHHKRSRDQIEDLFGSAAGSEIDISNLLDSMLLDNELKETDGLIALGDYWQARRESMGRIHSNIESRHGLTLVDGHTGSALMYGVLQVNGDSLHINGSNARVVARRDLKVEVLRSIGEQTATGSIKYTTGRGASISSHPILIRHYLDISDDVWPVIAEDDEYYVFHLQGPSMRLFLEFGLARGWITMSGVKKINEWYILTTYEPNKPHISNIPSQFAMTAGDLEQAESILGLPRFNKKLPDDMRQKEVLSWFDPMEEREKMSMSSWDRTVRPDDEALLRLFE